MLTSSHSELAPFASSKSATCKTGPLRTCVGCRRVDAQSALVRVTAEGHGLRLDIGHRNSGRGAYVHARSSCLAGAERGGFSRSFRISIERESIAPIRKHIQVMLKSEDSNE